MNHNTKQKAGRARRRGALALCGIGALTATMAVAGPAQASDRWLETDVERYGITCSAWGETTPANGDRVIKGTCDGVPAGIQVRLKALVSYISEGSGMKTDWVHSDWVTASQLPTITREMKYGVSEVGVEFQADPSGAGSSCSAQHVKTARPFASDDHLVSASCTKLAPHVQARGALDMVAIDDLRTEWFSDLGSTNVSRTFTGGITRDARMEYRLNPNA